MSETSDLLNSLTFTADRIDTLYLDKPRVHEQFVNNLGAIVAFIDPSGVDDVRMGLGPEV